MKLREREDKKRNMRLRRIMRCRRREDDDEYDKIMTLRRIGSEGEN